MFFQVVYIYRESLTRTLRKIIYSINPNVGKLGDVKMAEKQEKVRAQWACEVGSVPLSSNETPFPTRTLDTVQALLTCKCLFVHLTPRLVTPAWATVHLSIVSGSKFFI